MKQTALVLSLVLCAMLCACESRDTEIPDTPPTLVTEAPEPETFPLTAPSPLDIPEADVQEWCSRTDVQADSPEPIVVEASGFTFQAQKTDGGAEHVTYQDGDETLCVWGNYPDPLLWNACFTDLNEDGFPELCATIATPDTPEDTFVYMYDTQSRTGNSLSAYQESEFRLAVEDGVLYVYESPFDAAETLPEGGTRGRLRLYNQELFAVPEETLQAQAPEPVDVPAGETVCWFDFINDTAHLPSNFARFSLTAFPEQTFMLIRYRGKWCTSISTQIHGTETEIIADNALLQAYFTDLDGDGMPELCTSVSSGSGIVDSHIVVYQISSHATYYLWERGENDYRLTLENGKLLVERTAYGSLEATADKGTLVLKDNTLQFRKLSS